MGRKKFKGRQIVGGWRGLTGDDGTYSGIQQRYPTFRKEWTKFLPLLSFFSGWTYFLGRSLDGLGLRPIVNRSTLSQIGGILPP